MYANTERRPAPAARKLTAPDLKARKQGPRQGAETRERISMVTAYDYTMARLFDEAGVDAVLVGDSLGMVVQGLQNTLPVTLDEMTYHCRAVARALGRAHLVGDLPFMSYQASVVQALESAGRLLKDGACEGVKLEGGADFAEHVYRMVRAGIPVMGHVGLTPQSVHAFGGFKLQGRGDEAAQRIFEDAKAIEEAGAYAVVLEAVPPDVAARITEALSIPTIGIGAGVECDGQVLVYSDLLGLSRGHTPKFAKQFAQLGDAVVEATRAYVDAVQLGSFPGAEQTFKPNQAPAASTSSVLLTG